MRQKKRAGIFVVLLSACVFSGCSFLDTGNLAIVKNGKPFADIVIAEKPPRAVKLAAIELQSHLEKISGARLAIATAPGTNVPNHIYVGKSPYTDKLNITADGLKYGAFKMVSGENHLVLLGHDRDFTPPLFSPAGHNDWARVMKEWDERTGEKWGLPAGPVFKSYSPAVGVWDYDERGSLYAV
ncbi:MAG: hypothetical protein WC299_13120, partial [Kiritimatiellia bacterium]